MCGGYRPTTRLPVLRVRGGSVFSLGILVFNSNPLVAQIPEIISFPQISAGSRGFLAYIPYYQRLRPCLLPYCPCGTNLKF